MKKTKIKILLLKLILTIFLLNTNIGYCSDDTRPNIVFILTDDQRADTINETTMPTVYNEIFLNGTQFKNHFATTPICGPSRVSIFTGLHATEHGMPNNSSKEKVALNEYSIARKLKEAGYYTGLVGKFHNTSNGQFSKNRRSEFDFWVSHRKGSAHYKNLAVNKNGRFSRKSNFYVTNFWNRQAIGFINKASRTNKPFFLTLSHNAPHSPAIPDEKYKRNYNKREFNAAPTFLDLSDTGKADWVNKRKRNYSRNKRLMRSKEKNIKNFASKQLATLMSVDQGVKRIITRLKRLGLYENTIFIYMSDNGLMWGEHCLQSKNNVYEEATRIPLAISYPNPNKDESLFPKTEIDEITANIDIAPTLAALAGIDKNEYQVSGISLIDIINGRNLRDGILIQGNDLRKDKYVYIGYHTKEFMYSETEPNREEELYNTTLDPYEQENLANRPEFEDIKKELQIKLYKELVLHDQAEINPMTSHAKEVLALIAKDTENVNTENSYSEDSEH